MKHAGYCNVVETSPDQFVIVPTQLEASKFKSLFRSRRDNGRNGPVMVTIDDTQHRTKKQLAAFWTLVDILFQTWEGRKPTKTEAYQVYEDLLEVYGERVPSRIDPSRLRLVRASEGDSLQLSKLIEGALEQLADAGLPKALQSTVRQAFYNWQAWRGEQKIDPIDATTPTAVEFRKRNKLCMACSIGGEGIQIAHIISRGADGSIIDEPWNWMLLCHDHHRFQHQHGWGRFLAEFPHLEGRFKRAKEFASKGIENE